MNEQTAKAAAASRRWLAAVAIGVAVLVFTRLRASIPAYVELHVWLDGLAVPSNLRNLDAPLLILLAALAGACLASPARPLSALGLRKSPGTGVRFGLLAALPMVMQAAIDSTGVRLDWSTVRGGLIAPVVEETFFRGLLVAIPVVVGGTRFWSTAITSALLFGSMHVPWSADIAWTDLPTFGITAIGGLWYAWLMRIYGFSLWPTLALHAAMNAAWLVFDTGGGAVGGLWPNVGRGMTIALGTVMALRHQRRKRAATA